MPGPGHPLRRSAAAVQFVYAMRCRGRVTPQYRNAEGYRESSQRAARLGAPVAWSIAAERRAVAAATTARARKPS